MFSVEQKRSIADKIQRILRDTGHPELPVTEIEFVLHVHGRFQWSWADIQNNAAVSVPSVNPWNEAQAKAIPPEPQHGREPKPLAQYLATVSDMERPKTQAFFEQALEAYESTENVMIQIIKKKAR